MTTIQGYLADGTPLKVKKKDAFRWVQLKINKECLADETQLIISQGYLADGTHADDQ